MSRGRTGDDDEDRTATATSRRRRATSLYLSSFPFANIPFKRRGKPRPLHRFFCRVLRVPGACVNDWRRMTTYVSGFPDRLFRLDPLGHAALGGVVGRRRPRRPGRRRSRPARGAVAALAGQGRRGGRAGRGRCGSSGNGGGADRRLLVPGLGPGPTGASGAGRGHRGRVAPHERVETSCSCRGSSGRGCLRCGVAAGGRGHGGSDAGGRGVTGEGEEPARHGDRGEAGNASEAGGKSGRARGWHAWGHPWYTAGCGLLL